MILVDLRQGSPEWLAWRSGGLGSSDAAAIVGASPWRTREQTLVQKEAWLRGRPLPDEDNWAMARGRRLEPLARREYESLMGWGAPPVCGEHATHRWLRASCDGWVAPRRLVVEIKCPGKPDHTLALSRQVPEKYRPQVHHLTLVSGAPLLHYVSFHPDFPPGKRLAVVPVPRDQQAIDLLLEAEREFWDELTARLRG